MVLFFYLLLPALIIAACIRWRWLNAIGAVVLCYILGAFFTWVFAVIPGIPPLDADLKESVSGITVLLALPLLLFSVDIPGWLKLGVTTLKSLASAVITVTLLSFLGGILFQDQIADIWKLVGLSTSLYLGGTPNLAIIKESLNADTGLFLQLHAYDTLLTMGYILFMATFAQKLFARFLPAFDHTPFSHEAEVLEVEGINQFKKLVNFHIWKRLLIAALLAAIIILPLEWLSVQLFGHLNMVFVMISLTIASLACSFRKSIREIPNTFELGLYLVMVFCVLMGSMITSKQLTTLNIPLALFVILVVFGSLLLHVVIACWLKIDVDTTIITSVATICSPPFIPMFVAALRNQQILLSGIGAGIIGYVLGNILGLSAAYLFRYLF